MSTREEPVVAVLRDALDRWHASFRDPGGPPVAVLVVEHEDTYGHRSSVSWKLTAAQAYALAGEVS